MGELDRQIQADRNVGMWIADAVTTWRDMSPDDRACAEWIAATFDKPLSWALDYYGLYEQALKRREGLPE